MPEFLARKYFREMEELEALIEDFGDLARTRIVDHVEYKGRRFPLYCVEIGSTKKTDPTIGFFGGVHGLEKIGSEVVLAWMHTVCELLRWDESFRRRFADSRMVFMPIVNPVGIVLHRRSNGQGVDLMRNAPIDSDQKGGPIFCGHRISPQLPWYRGKEGAPMEVEAKALCQVVKEEIFPARISLTVDVHSGFGAKDRFWFPYARTRKPFPYLSEVYALKENFDHTFPHHFYEIEPVSRQYMINGDLWDYLFALKQEQTQKPDFFPWTLEMGSWMWLRKNPMQLFNRFGVFHPIKPHRYQRILRRHFTLFDFLHRSLVSPKSWSDLSDEQKQIKNKLAMDLWYDD